MERKIGEIFEYKGEWYQCVEGRCKDCYFEEKRYLCKQFITKNFCTSNIIFKKLEKVGEPYEYFVQGNGIIMVHEYILYNLKYARDVIHNLYIFDCQNGRIAIEIKQNKEDMEDLDKIKVRDYTKVEELNVMEENKLNLKPFDLEAARSGKPVCTRDGRKARIICFDRKVDTPIVALIEHVDGSEILQCYFDNGKCCHNETSDYDLMMLPEKKEGWVNVYKGGLLDTKSYPTKKEAFDKASPKDYIDTIKISWEE